MRREGLVVVAAGMGTRLGPAAGGGPKALVTVRGRMLLDLALEGIRAAGIDLIVVVHTPGLATAFEDVCAQHGVSALVPGGETRSDSVRAGLAALPADVGVIGVHDAARALIPPETIRAVFDAVRDDVVAVAPGVAVADTLKRVTEDGTVTATVERASLQGVQTPQVFRSDALRLAHHRGATATDDLGLVEQAVADGAVAGRVRLVAGSPRGFKITFPADLELADALLAASAAGGAG